MACRADAFTKDYKSELFVDVEEDILTTVTFYKKEGNKLIEVGILKYFLANKKYTREELEVLFDDVDTDAVYAAENMQEIQAGDIYLHFLKVHEEFRHNGYGKELIHWLEHLNKKTKQIFFLVFEDKIYELVEFYRKAFQKFSLEKLRDNFVLFYC